MGLVTPFITIGSGPTLTLCEKHTIIEALEGLMPSP